jgi:hypothetical protein
VGRVPQITARQLLASAAGLKQFTVLSLQLGPQRRHRQRLQPATALHIDRAAHMEAAWQRQVGPRFCLITPLPAACLTQSCGRGPARNSCWLASGTSLEITEQLLEMQASLRLQLEALEDSPSAKVALQAAAEAAAEAAGREGATGWVQEVRDLGHLDALVEAAGSAVVAVALYSRVRIDIPSGGCLLVSTCGCCGLEAVTSGYPQCISGSQHS